MHNVQDASKLLCMFSSSQHCASLHCSVLQMRGGKVISREVASLQHSREATNQPSNHMAAIVSRLPPKRYHRRQSKGYGGWVTNQWHRNLHHHNHNLCSQQSLCDLTLMQSSASLTKILQPDFAPICIAYHLLSYLPLLKSLEKVLCCFINTQL